MKTRQPKTMFTMIAMIVGFIMTNIIEKPAAKYFS